MLKQTTQHFYNKQTVKGSHTFVASKSLGLYATLVCLLWP